MRDLKDVRVDQDNDILNILDGNDKIINIISLGVICLYYKNSENYYNNYCNNNHACNCNYGKINASNNNNRLNNNSNNIASNSRYLFDK